MQGTDRGLTYSGSLLILISSPVIQLFYVKMVLFSLIFVIIFCCLYGFALFLDKTRYKWHACVLVYYIIGFLKSVFISFWVYLYFWYWVLVSFLLSLLLYFHFFVVFMAVSGAQPEILQGREGLVKLGHFDKHFIKKSRKKAP